MSLINGYLMEDAMFAGEGNIVANLARLAKAETNMKCATHSLK